MTSPRILYLVLAAAVVVVVVALEIASSPVTATSSSSSSSACGQTIDVVFNLDGSGSISAANFIQEKNFAKATAQLFDDSFVGARYGMVQFGASNNRATARVMFQLTYNASVIAPLVDQVRQFGGSTPLWLSLNTSQDLLNAQARPGVPRMIVLLSDGAPTGDPNARALSLAAATGAKAQGTRILTIGVNLDAQTTADMKYMATSEAFAFDISAIDQLPTIIGSIVDRSCTEITSLSSTCGLLGGGANVTVTGRNFFRTGNLLRCRFTFSDKSSVEVPALHVDDSNIVCSTPPAPVVGQTVLEVTIDGQGYTQDNKRFLYVTNLGDCSTSSTTGFFLLVLGMPLVLLLPLLTAVASPIASSIVGAASGTAIASGTAMTATHAPLVASAGPAPSDEPLPPGHDPRFKHQVAGSAYLWNFAGGAAPLRVGWGEVAPPSAPKGHDWKDTWSGPAMSADDHRHWNDQTWNNPVTRQAARSVDAVAWAQANSGRRRDQCCNNTCVIL